MEAFLKEKKLVPGLTCDKMSNCKQRYWSKPGPGGSCQPAKVHTRHGWVPGVGKHPRVGLELEVGSSQEAGMAETVVDNVGQPGMDIAKHGDIGSTA